MSRSLDLERSPGQRPESSGRPGVTLMRARRTPLISESCTTQSEVRRTRSGVHTLAGFPPGTLPETIPLTLRGGKPGLAGRVHLVR